MKSTTKRTSRCEQIWRVSTLGLFITAGIAYAIAETVMDWAKDKKQWAKDWWFEIFGEGENYR